MRHKPVHCLVCARMQKVLQLRRDTETGVRTFVRSKTWRDASKVWFPPRHRVPSRAGLHACSASAAAPQAGMYCSAESMQSYITRL